MNDTSPIINGSNFFSSGLRQKVDRLMDVLYAGGVNNPMDSIEQISYLLFRNDDRRRDARRQSEAAEGDREREPASPASRACGGSFP
jgi:hypothetical protein